LIEGKKMHKCRFIFTFLLLITAAFGLIGGCNDSDSANIPPDIQAIFDKPLYKNSLWGLRVVDLNTGAVLINLRPDYPYNVTFVC
jgi:hypothetical protein